MGRYGQNVTWRNARLLHKEFNCGFRAAYYWLKYQYYYLTLNHDYSTWKYDKLAKIYFPQKINLILRESDKELNFDYGSYLYYENRDITNKFIEFVNSNLSNINNLITDKSKKLTKFQIKQQRKLLWKS